MKYHLQHSRRERLINGISLSLERRKEIAAAYIFGSFALADRFSDINLGLLTCMELDSPLDYESRLETELTNIIYYPVDVRIINNAPVSFCQNVIRDGRVILEHDSNLRAAFTGRILKQYFDFAPFRKQHVMEVPGASI